VWTFGVVVDPPRLDASARRREAAEQVLVEALVPEAAVEALHEPILLWLAGAM